MEQGILRIREQELGEVEAHSVKIGVTIEGETLLYGNAAMEKCEEVKRAVEKLKAIEPEVGIYVKSVQVKSESGWFSKSSKGVYRLEIMLKNLGKINEILGIVMDMKNVDLELLEWVFDEDDVKMELIKKAMAKAKKKADDMMAVVGYRVVGIRACSDSYEIPNVNITLRSPISDLSKAASLGARSRKAGPTMDLGTEMKGKNEITAIASVEFIIDKESA